MNHFRVFFPQVGHVTRSTHADYTHAALRPSPYAGRKLAVTFHKSLRAAVAKGDHLAITEPIKTTAAEVRKLKTENK